MRSDPLSEVLMTGTSVRRPPMGSFAATACVLLAVGLTMWARRGGRPRDAVTPGTPSPAANRVAPTPSGVGHVVDGPLGSAVIPRRSLRPALLRRRPGGSAEVRGQAPDNAQGRGDRFKAIVYAALAALICAFCLFSIADRGHEGLQDTRIEILLVGNSGPQDITLNLNSDNTFVRPHETVELRIDGQAPNDGESFLLASQSLTKHLSECSELANIPPDEVDDSWVKNHLQPGIQLYRIDLDRNHIHRSGNSESYLFSCTLPAAMFLTTRTPYTYFHTPDFRITTEGEYSASSKVCTTVEAPVPPLTLRQTSADPPATGTRYEPFDSSSLMQWNSCNPQTYWVGRKYHFTSLAVRGVVVTYTDDAADRNQQRLDLLLGALLGVAGGLAVASFDVFVEWDRRRGGSADSTAATMAARD